MFASVLVIALVLAHPPESHPSDICRCAVARVDDGWCPKCEVGYYANIQIKSVTLFETLDLHGHEIDPKKSRCESCRAAHASGGFCESCHMGFIDGRGFFSRVCYAMAKGATAPPPPDGQAYAERWCGHCHSGRVANRAFSSESDWSEARRWRDILAAAAKKADACEPCATAMITDGRCFRCRVQYRDGKPAAAAPVPGETRTPAAQSAHSDDSEKNPE